MLSAPAARCVTLVLCYKIQERLVSALAFRGAGVVRPGSTGGLSRSNQCRWTRIDERAVAVEPLISEVQIRDRLQAMGRQIEDDYREKPLTIVAVLTGSLIALADLVRQIQIPLRIALVQTSSYKGATTTATTLVVNEAFAPDVAGRDVLLLDDILDTGHTLGALVQHLKDRGARSVRTAVLLRKIGRQIVLRSNPTTVDSSFPTRLSSAMDWITTMSIGIYLMLGYFRSRC